MAPLGTTLIFPYSDFRKKKVLPLQVFLGFLASGDSALPRRPLRWLGNWRHQSWRQTSAFQAPLPGQLWALLQGLHQYTSLLPTTFALSHNNKVMGQMIDPRKGHTLKVSSTVLMVLRDWEAGSLRPPTGEWPCSGQRSGPPPGPTCRHSWTRLDRDRDGSTRGGHHSKMSTR